MVIVLFFLEDSLMFWFKSKTGEFLKEIVACAGSEYINIYKYSLVYFQNLPVFKKDNSLSGIYKRINLDE